VGMTSFRCALHLLRSYSDDDVDRRAAAAQPHLASFEHSRPRQFRWPPLDAQEDGRAVDPTDGRSAVSVDITQCKSDT